MIHFENDRERRSEGLYYAKRQRNLSCRLHLHDSFELVVMEAGTLAATVEGTAYTLHGGEALLVFPNQIHGYEKREGSLCGVFIFPAALVGEYFEKMRKKQPHVPVFSLQDPHLCDALLSVGERRWQLKSLLYGMLDAFDRTATYLPRHGAGTDLLGQIISRIAERYTEPLTLRTLAAELGYDHRYLTNLIQKELHSTFRHLLNEYRISRAEELLLRTDSPVEQIAGECGYESLCSFNRNFKGFTGTTPTAWRARHA
jgi:AraC-like DNA-binding protein